ncbi:MBL fold metallo-hydrolase [Acetobacterium woodii]|uniref:Zn-dependent hydrolase of the beta-lactamase fold-like protein n=1 Tax=Acetobacterium woodii (strain ATCC 29683 / DSM 1030 / JCM 2381 / KCTC 1655 / WB1) TaxID=931626 RepID=H6LKY6_ACEWD|nr:MBL fold metallo-hydrolase [Acetobacterium woodii]AFA50095.1 Zn-dependent hydrolase of the beta-lactamase fold-like protein [Acetobacterium woodii DSM 1030]
MKIKWFGQSCFRLTSENGIKIVMDPYANMLGYKLPEIDANIVTTSHDHSDHNNVDAVKGDFVHIKDPGVFSPKGIGIKGIQTFHDNVFGAKKGNNIIYTFMIDGINICHCGDLGHLLSLEQINQIGKVDILLLPIGGRVTLDANSAVEVMKQLNPAVVIPMHYRTKAMGILGFVFGKVEPFITASTKEAKNYKELDINLSNIKDLPEIAVLQYN